MDSGIPGLSSLNSCPLPPLPSFLSPLIPPSLSPEAPPPKPARGLGLGSAVSSPSGVWGEAPADKWFGAYRSQKEQLWWQQFLCIWIWIWIIVAMGARGYLCEIPCIFIRINLNFCTNTRLLSSRYSVSLRAKQSGSRCKAPGQGVSRGTKLIMLMTFCNLMHKFVKQV